MKGSKDSKNLIIGMLGVVICIMAVAYAGFVTTLKINGTASVLSMWDVGIESATCTPSGATATASVMSKTVATIDIGFTHSDESAKCVVVYKNNGTLPAVLEHTVVGAEGTRAIKWSISGAQNPKSLEPGESHTVTIVGRYEPGNYQPLESEMQATLQIISTAREGID